MIHFQKTQDLILPTGFISAASGLVLFENRFYVIADDDLYLGVFSAETGAPGKLYPLLSGTLPREHQARKKMKPDFESLVLLPSADGSPIRELLAIPSGSTQNRMTGVRVQMRTGATTKINFQPLYDKLSRIFSELNIEGAVACDNKLLLFQRGNGSKHENAIIHLNFNNGQLLPDCIEKIVSYDLGKLNGVPLSFTDAWELEDRSILFAAAAENTNDTYNDGKCEGSVMGKLDRDGKIIFMDELFPSMKAEGLAARRVGQKLEIFIVTDADNEKLPAGLFFAVLE